MGVHGSLGVSRGILLALTGGRVFSMGLPSAPIRLQRSPIGFHESSMGLPWAPMGVHVSVVGYHGRP